MQTDRAASTTAVVSSAEASLVAAASSDVESELDDGDGEAAAYRRRGAMVVAGAERGLEIVVGVGGERLWVATGSVGTAMAWAAAVASTAVTDGCDRRGDGLALWPV